MELSIISINHPSNQFNFKSLNTITLPSFKLYKDNKFTKMMINNRHDLKMSKYNNAGYGYQIFYGPLNVGSIWFLNQINSKTTYIRVSRYESYRQGFFIAVLSELSDYFKKSNYSLLLKTKISYAQKILDKNFQSKVSKKSNNKRGSNDRSTKNVSVDGLTYYIDFKTDTYIKWYKEVSIIDA